MLNADVIPFVDGYILLILDIFAFIIRVIMIILKICVKILINSLNIIVTHSLTCNLSPLSLTAVGGSVILSFSY